MLERKASADEKLSGLAFKVAADPYIGTLTFYRTSTSKLLILVAFPVVSDLFSIRFTRVFDGSSLKIDGNSTELHRTCV